MSDLEKTGHRWQVAAANFIRQVRPALVVETGVSEGVSTIRFLEALDDNGFGRLVSIDPSPAYTTPHPRWTLIQKTSLEALVDIYVEHGPFDIFIHDSDHWATCQYWEYAMALHLVKPRGYIMSDDWVWGSHGAWPNFCHRNNLPHDTLGYAALTQKPATGECPSEEEARALAKKYLAEAHAFAASVGDQPPESLYL